ncbi:hypothetical protein C1H46_042971 [Malus baccata]|uniref:Uncharacterized protein n=1 Tax=Malus baccata TaxID=106549 RepID=A0A540KB99_MALBA|nr:hypothetical protein C1H46_042971 [Malus baccata]
MTKNFLTVKSVYKTTLIREGEEPQALPQSKLDERAAKNTIANTANLTVVIHEEDDYIPFDESLNDDDKDGKDSAPQSLITATRTWMTTKFASESRSGWFIFSINQMLSKFTNHPT